MRLPLANNASALLFTVDGFSDSENVSTIDALRPTLAAPFDGVTATTVGGVVSNVAAVRNHS